MMFPKSEEFFDYLKEREEIRLRKGADFPYPWTDDPILQTYKFTNVRRHHDRTSMELRERFYGPHFIDDKYSHILNCAIFRYFGTWEFAEALGWTKYDEYDPEIIKDLATQRLEKRQRVFTGAYIITNQGISAPKQEVVVDHFISGLYENIPRIVQIANETQSWEKTAKEMMKIKGFGGTGFMTKEVLLDTTYTLFWSIIKEDPIDGSFSFPDDWDKWTPIGPGARRGAARLIGDDTATALSEQQSRQIIHDLHVGQSVESDLNFSLSPTDIQFGLCEFDKYERVRLGQGRPRSKYKR